MLRDNLPSSCRIANWDGPTETNVCTFHDVAAEDVDRGDPIPIGKPCPYATTSLTTDDDVVTSDGATGELLVATDSLMTGYWKLPDATSRVFSARSDGRVYCSTGDLVSEDPAHRLTFRGRVDRLLKVRGFRVQPEEVEHVLEQRAEIDEAAVVMRRRGDVDVLAAVVRVAGGEAWTTVRSSATAAGCCRPIWFPMSSCLWMSYRVVLAGKPTTGQCSSWWNPIATTAAPSWRGHSCRPSRPSAGLVLIANSIAAAQRPNLYVSPSIGTGGEISSTW